MSKKPKQMEKNRSRFQKSYHELRGIELSQHLEHVPMARQSAAGSAILIRAIIDLMNLHSAKPNDIASELLAISGEDALAEIASNLEAISSELRRLLCIS
ncbi:MAG TPA: hypothetical protein P5539_10845 [Mesotoga sp.]|nr:hypothetical protein [Mesotoga sp.]